MICPHCGKEIEEYPSGSLVEDLHRAERLAFTGRIAASIAHEIRNPLTNLAMSVDQLKKQSQSESPWAKHLDIILRNTDRINVLITELLNCARPPKLNLHPHDIHLILENALESNKMRLQHIEVIKNFAPDLSVVNIDREQIDRAFTNLVMNAVDAMPKGGKLTFTTESMENFFIVKIQDTGNGIHEEDIMKIFDPFFSTKPKGVGLGLTLCYGIIISHGGTIEVESESGKGTVFTVLLPLKEKARVREARF